MQRYRFLWVVVGLSLTASMLVAGGALADSDRHFTASLKGRNEVSPVDTNAQGQAVLKLNNDETELQFKLIAANIEGVTQAHIHCGAADVNGPVVAFLFPLNPAGVDVNGILSEGTITQANVIPRPDSPACPGGVANFDDMLEKIRSGEAYVNIHTTANPGGQVRGQLR